MKTIIYKKIKNLAGMATVDSYLNKYPDCVEKIKQFDYLIPYSRTSLVLNGKVLRVSGCIFDLDEQTLKILTE